MSDGSSHIDPGDPPRSRYTDDLNCHTSSERLETHHPNGADAGVPYGGDMGPRHIHPFAVHCYEGCPAFSYKAAVEAPRNLDPINAWRPGSVEEQRQRVHKHITQAEMGPVATYGLGDELPKALPEREGPDYTKGADAADSEALWVKLSMDIDSLPDRTNMILQGAASEALVSFVRHHLQYGDSDMELGYQGQFSELYHIVTKLKRLMWDRNWTGMATNTATGEIKEQLEALIGHSLLALNLLEEGNKDGRG